MPKGFTIEEKRILIEKFKDACSQSWMNFGYKKTSVDILCQEVGIAKGSFYTFFKNKEELFFQVYRDAQDRIFSIFEAILKNNLSKAVSTCPMPLMLKLGMKFRAQKARVKAIAAARPPVIRDKAKRDTMNFNTAPRPQETMGIAAIATSAAVLL